MKHDAASTLPTRLLVIDDDDDLLHSTARSLEMHGYSCITATTAAEARLFLDAERNIAAVLCDVDLPDRSGIELLRTLAADFSDIAVVMMTGVDDAPAEEVTFDLGAFGRVVKPFDIDGLLVALSSASRRRDLDMARRRRLRKLERMVARTKRLGEVLEELGGESGTPLNAGAEVIDRLSRAISPPDEETGQHIQRMSRFAVVIAQRVGFAGVPLEDLRIGSALHDVGKIGVPSSILLKPGPLTLSERTKMRRHAQIGYQLLADSTSARLRAGADIALMHHEWWDGGGYPRGLRGLEISEAARIAAVAEVFDALTSHRVYRPALPFDEALTVMRELRGRQFEPRLVDALCDSLDEVSAIRASYPETEGPFGRIRLLVVDDHEIFVHSLVRLLATRPEINVVGTAGNVSEAVSAATAYRPDVVLMDFDLPDGTGLQATAQIKALTPEVKVIMLTVHNDEQSLVGAIEAGCSGFVKKSDAVDGLFDAIAAAHRGEMIAGPDLTPLLVRLQPSRRGRGVELTTRENEILRLIASGLVNKEIAGQLGLRLNTVRNHVQNILTKLEVHSKLEAVAIAVREGILTYPYPAQQSA